MPEVPDEIIVEILSRLPVVPLIRFRCVSKSWKGLIDSPQFIKTHLNQSHKTNSILNIAITRNQLYWADFDVLDQTNMAFFDDIPNPLKSRDETLLLGSCNGLLALLNDGENNLILWNPSIRKFEKLPLTKIEYPGKDISIFEDIFYGFGYDNVCDDYKVVRIVKFFGDTAGEFYSKMEVYSLKSRIWKRIQDFPYYLKYGTNFGMFANGALHWVAYNQPMSHTDSLIVAFDLGTETYSLVPQPDYANENFLMTMSVIRGDLCIACNYCMNHVHIWVMKEYGIKESWTVLFTFRHYDVYLDCFGFVRPIALSKCGRKVLMGLDDQFLLWYDLRKESFDSPFVQFPTMIDYFRLDSCLQSLVLLNIG